MDVLSTIDTFAWILWLVLILVFLGTLRLGAKPGATQQECKALADAKLKESVDAMLAALLPR